MRRLLLGVAACAGAAVLIWGPDPETATRLIGGGFCALAVVALWENRS